MVINTFKRQFNQLYGFEIVDNIAWEASTPRNARFEDLYGEASKTVYIQALSGINITNHSSPPSYLHFRSFWYLALPRLGPRLCLVKLGDIWTKRRFVGENRFPSDRHALFFGLYKPMQSASKQVCMSAKWLATLRIPRRKGSWPMTVGMSPLIFSVFAVCQFTCSNLEDMHNHLRRACPAPPQVTSS